MNGGSIEVRSLRIEMKNWQNDFFWEKSNIMNVVSKSWSVVCVIMLLEVNLSEWR